MRPSIKWFPISLTERAAWFRNFSAQMQVHGPDLGLTSAEIASIQADSDMMTFLARASVAIEAYYNAFQAFRREMTEGDVGGAVPQFPADPGFAPPVGAEAGIFERLMRIVPRIRVAPAFTDEIEALLGIAPTRYRRKKTHLEDGSHPTLKATVEPGNVVTVKFVRGASHGIAVEMRLDNDEHWTDAGTFLRSPAELSIPQSEAHLPRRVQLRARFREGNDAVGDWSDVVTVQTIP